MRKTAKNGIRVHVTMNENGGIVTFPSIQELAKHLCLGNDKTRKLLNGRTMLTEAELHELEQLCYMPKNYDHLKKTAKIPRMRR